MESKVKKIILLIVLAFSCQVQFGQGVQFNWANQISGNGVPTYFSIIHDKFSNVLVVGDFTGTFDFDPGPGVYNLTAKGQDPNMFVIKLNPNGSFLWAKQINIVYRFNHNRIASDESGNVFIIGSFKGTIDFDPGIAIHNLRAGGGSEDGFILKLNRTGDFIWVKQLDGDYYTDPNAVALDDTGNIYLNGTFKNTTDFDPGVNVFNLTNSSGGLDIFILKLDSTGAFVWAKKCEGNIEIFGTNILIDNNGDVVVAGHFAGTVDFDPGPQTLKITWSTQGWDIFILKLDANGNFIWAGNIGGGYQRTIMSLVSDKNGNIYAYGGFTGTVDFDPGTNVYNLSTNPIVGKLDLFLLKLNSKGQFIWVRQITNKSPGLGDLALDGSHGVFIGGVFRDELCFNTQNCFTPVGPSDLFIAEIDSAGNFEWAKQLGGSGSEGFLFSVSSDSSSIYGSGQFSNTVDFDPDTGVYNLKDKTGSFFILKWSKCNASFSTIAATACDSFKWNNQTYHSSGKYKQVIKNHGGCDSTITLNLTVIKKPVAKFSIQSQQGCQFVDYVFTDESVWDTISPAGLTYNWDFGDGKTTTINTKVQIKYFKHIYFQNGTYTVRFSISNGFCSDNISMVNSVVILKAPMPLFTLSSKRNCAPYSLRIKDTLTSNIVSKEFDFGSGYVTLSNKKPLDTIIELNDVGIYCFKQRLTSTSGCITNFTDTIYLTQGLTSNNKVNVLYTSVIDSFTTLTKWNKVPNAVSYTIWNKITTDTFFTHVNASPSIKPEKYVVNALDICGHRSAISPVSQTIFLRGENQNFNEFALLQYTPYVGWKEGAMRYVIEYKNNITGDWRKLDSTTGNTLYLKTNMLPDSINSNISNFKICYRVIAVEQNGNQQRSMSNVICIPVYPTLFLPNAFSPNGDGLNDYYKPAAAGLNAYIFEIYDRWGQLVYSDAPESKGWDGTFRGEVLPEGVYYFRLSAAGFLVSPATNPARRVERKGILYLVR